MIKHYEGNYNKAEFYAIIGKYFAERQYRKLMPYLINDSDFIWDIIVVKNEVKGFISYKDKNDKVHIGYCYCEEDKYYKKLLSCIPRKHTLIELEKTFNKLIYENIGFEVYKETTNYWYMEAVYNENLS